ncbi:MAG: 30S ribosomal protein S1 [Phycisphaerae bacterium]|nr:30S ribosomal protein S1 [Phycisphaerae bacterium]
MRRQDSPLDAELQQELDQALGDASIEDLMDQADAAEVAPAPDAKPRPSIPGLRRGRVMGVDGRYVLVDLGSKSQGVIPVEQFDEKRPRPGDTVEALFDHYDRNEGLVHLSLKGAVAAAAWETLEEGQIVEGRVTGVNKGGLELNINGIRGFMPASQVDIVRVEDVSVYLNEKIRCQVTDLDRREKNLVVSRRAVVELEREQQREKTWADLDVDQVRTGVVQNIMPYGAFVDIGGVDGLLHVSDLSYGRVDKVEDVLKSGQRVEVKVLKIDRDSRKVSLGLKQLTPNPWTTVGTRYARGQRLDGRVTRTADFGAFVELEPGVEGLIPVSEIAWSRVNHPKDVLRGGQAVQVMVLSVDADRQRISLSLKQAAAENPWTSVTGKYAPEQRVAGKVTRIADFGAFIELEPGVEGLVHVSQLSDKHVKHPSDVVKPGDLVDVRVISVDADEQRISLSMKTSPSAAAQQAVEAAASQAPEAPRKKKDRPKRGGIGPLDGGIGLGDLKL